MSQNVVPQEVFVKSRKSPRTFAKIFGSPDRYDWSIFLRNFLLAFSEGLEKKDRKCRPTIFECTVASLFSC